MQHAGEVRRPSELTPNRQRLTARRSSFGCGYAALAGLSVTERSREARQTVRNGGTCCREPPLDLVFQDGLESGTADAWSEASP